MITAHHRSRFSDYRGSTGTGLPPVELWGIATKDATHRWEWSTKAKRRVLVPLRKEPPAPKTSTPEAA